jgi:hypothetical protein
MNKFEDLENRKIEMTAGEILIKVMHEENREKAEALKNKAIEAGMDFTKIDQWLLRNPELSVGQLLQKAKIRPEETFEI